METNYFQGVQNDWAGRPFQDLLNLITHLESVPFLDQSKAVIAGGSYGGFLISWMFGHEIIKKVRCVQSKPEHRRTPISFLCLLPSQFCCAVWHDGVFSTSHFVSSRDYPVNDGSFGTSWMPWIDPEDIERYNPSSPRRLQHFKHAPPTIVIHSEKDYRCPITEGISLFRTLQAHRVPGVFLTFPDECHWVEREENSLQWYREVWSWVRRCVDGDVKRGSFVY